MPKLTLQTLGRRLLERRGSRGVRSVAIEIGISPATLSRVERGFQPDLDTFKRVCQWLGVDPAEVLGMRNSIVSREPGVAVHFKKDQALKPATARALAQMILAAQRAWLMSRGRKT